MIRIYINKKVAEANKANGTDEPSIVIHDTWSDERVHALCVRAIGPVHFMQDPKAKEGPSTYAATHHGIDYQTTRDGDWIKHTCLPGH